MSALYWLSFVDSAKSDPPDQQVPGGGGFLGVAIVAADTPDLAVSEAWAQGCNPGGEVQIFELPSEAAEAVPPSSRNRLLTQAEAEAL